MTTSNWQTGNQQQITTSGAASNGFTLSTETDSTTPAFEWGDHDIELLPSGD